MRNAYRKRMNHMLNIKRLEQVELSSNREITTFLLLNCPQLIKKNSHMNEHPKPRKKEYHDAGDL